MNNRALTLSLVMAAVAVWFVYEYVTGIEQDTQRRFGTEVLVLKATRDIKEMETINETLMDFQPMPKLFLEPAAVYFEAREENKDAITSKKNLAGTIAVVPIKKGEQITYNKLIEPSMRTGLSPQITPGKRAISVPVNEVSGVSKLVKPGDRVDLIAVISMGQGPQNKVARTILQDVVVLAVGRSVTNNVARTVELDQYTGKEKVRNLAEDPNFAAVTVEVEPAQAQAMTLVLSNQDSQVFLSLRNNDDTDRVQVDPVQISDIGGDRVPAAVKR
jgi:pilus assembly protein CpaB